MTDLHSVSKPGAVTVEDADSSDFDLDDEYESAGSGASSHARNVANGSGSSASAAAPSDTDRTSLSQGEESGFEVWLRHSVNEPILALLPESVSPNSISFANTAACWLAFILSYIAYKYEHVYPVMALSFRVIVAVLVFSSIVMDCLDGMQARKTGRCSKLGEVLDHSLDAANIPLCSCAVIMTIYPDIYTILISLIGGVMVYNAQLVIYRHHHIFVLPPITGPVAQFMVCCFFVTFGVFFRIFDRHSYGVQLVIMVFALVGNVTQAQNSLFYTRRLLTANCIWPHIRFVVTMCLHGLLLLLGYVTIPEYLLSVIMLAYRLNGRYVLDTLATFRPFSASYTREQIKREDVEWRWECIGSILLLLVLAVTTGTGADGLKGDSSMPHTSSSVTGLPLVTDSLFHLALYAFMVACGVLNVLDLKRALPVLNTPK